MLISVIIPVYNAEQYLKKCLNSILVQTYRQWEVIAIDDGSKDDSYKILEEYAANDSRFLVESKENEGPGLTRNRALDRANGDYIVFLDSDDYIEPNYFALLFEKVKKTSAEVVFIDIIQEKENGKVIAHEKMSKFQNFCRKKMIGCQMTGYMPWGGCRKAVSRSLIEKHHLRYTDDVVGEEAVFSFELLRNAKEVAFIAKDLYHYINHPGSQSKDPNGTWAITLKKMRDHLETQGMLEEYEEHVDSFAFVVLISWLLRYSKKNSTGRTLIEFIKRRKDFEEHYGWMLKSEYMRKEVRFLVPLVKYGVLLPVVVAAKLVRR